MSRIKISIIVPIYNSEQYLVQCLESLLHQDILYSEYEIILVNDGSRDNSGKIAKCFSDNYNNILYFEQDNQGQAVARNFGMDVAQGEYIMFVDSDDFLYENVLNNIYSASKNEDADVCICNMRVMKQDGSSSVDGDMRNKSKCPMSGREALLKGITLGSACVRLYSRDFLKSYDARFPKGIKHEDSYFNLSLLPYAKKMIFDDSVIYCYRWNDCSTDRNRNESNVLRGLLGDLEVAVLAKKLCETFDEDRELTCYLQKLSASIIIGDVLSFLSLKQLLCKQTKKTFICHAKQKHLIPIVTNCLDLKKWILANIINAVYGW